MKKEQFKDGCSKKKQSNTTCTENNETKNCQAEKCDMQPKKPKKDMQSNKLAMLIQQKMSKKQKQMPQEDDKSCQSKSIMDQNVLTGTVKKRKITICGQ